MPFYMLDRDTSSLIMNYKSARVLARPTQGLLE